jgi:hypothetical protein
LIRNGSNNGTIFGVIVGFEKRRDVSKIDKINLNMIKPF